MRKTLNLALVAFIAIAVIVGISVSGTQAAGKPGTPGGKPITCTATCDTQVGLYWVCWPIYDRVDREWVFSGEWDCYWGDSCTF